MPACGAGSETVRHFLLECPGYAHERWALEKALMLENLLGDEEVIVPITNLSVSHRFVLNT
jgi:hypothetical protein